MAENDIPNQGLFPASGGNSAEPQANPAMVIRRRGTSISLRDGQAESASTLMDPANKSLADALKITYRILQVGMVAVVGVFALSGLQSIQTGERGIRLLAGAVQADDLPPGFQFSVPRPIGEIVKIKTGVETMALSSQFFPGVAGGSGNEKLGVQELAGSSRPQLNPATDGAMLSADLSLAHGRFTVQYQRTDIRSNARNITPEAENNLIVAAAIRGITQAAARLSVDEIIKNQPDATRVGDFPALDIEARRVAQEMLDKLGSGIEIVQFNVEDRQPPLFLISAFASVQTRQSDASREIQKAQTERTERLAAVAGEATPVLLALIDRYEQALTTLSPEAESLLLQVDLAMEGKAFTLDGKAVDPRISGRVAGTLSEAQQYRSSVVSRAQADARVFEAKLQAFRANPSVVIAGDWSEALAVFLNRDSVQVFMLPGGKLIDLVLNRDPELAKLQERMRTEAAAKQIEQDRLKKVDNLPTENYKNIGTTTSQ